MNESLHKCPGTVVEIRRKTILQLGTQTGLEEQSKRVENRVDKIDLMLENDRTTDICSS